MTLGAGRRQETIELPHRHPGDSLTNFSIPY